MAKWDDLIDFEVYRVITSSEAAARIAPLQEKTGFSIVTGLTAFDG
jgi:hypothetical protein